MKNESKSEEFDTEWTDVPVCPHCGAKDEDWWDGLDIAVLSLIFYYLP